MSKNGVRGGIDLGGTKIQAIVIDAHNTVLGESRRPTPEDNGPQGVADAMAEVLNAAASAAGVETGALKGVGVGAEAELGAGRERDSILGVFWGTGVGGGIVLNGELWHGRGSAGEIGHMVVKRGGARCPCGNRGCMEAYAGRAPMEAEARRRHEKGEKTDLFKLMKEHDRPRLTSGIWERALDHGDKMAEELIDRAIKALGAGIGSAVNLIDPDVVILGGGLGVRLGDPYRKRLEHAMLPHVFADTRPPPVLLAQLGDLGGAIGAALLASEAEAAYQ